MSDDPARDEFKAARKAARDKRRAFAASPDTAFVKAMQHAMGLYLAARDQGVSREDGLRGLEEELRAAWPKSVSKFPSKCADCDDTGYRELTCWDHQRCGREVCAKNPERQHSYVVPCGCAAGDRKRRRERAPEDALAAVGRTQKKRGFSRMGQ